MSANIGIALQIFMLHEFWVFVAVVLVAWLRWSLTHSSKHHACLEVSLRVRVFVGLHTLELSILAHAVVRTIFFQKYDYLGLMRHWFWTADGSGEYPRKCVKRWPLPLNLKSNEPPLIFKIYWQRALHFEALWKNLYGVSPLTNEIGEKKFPPVTPGSIPLSLAPGVPHADQRNGFVLEVGQQPVTQAHLLHRSYRVRVAFHQPVRHLELDFMRICLMES